MFMKINTIILFPNVPTLITLSSDHIMTSYFTFVLKEFANHLQKMYFNQLNNILYLFLLIMNNLDKQ